MASGEERSSRVGSIFSAPKAVVGNILSNKRRRRRSNSAVPAFVTNIKKSFDTTPAPDGDTQLLSLTKLSDLWLSNAALWSIIGMNMFVRLGFDSDPEQILYLFEQVWKTEQPKLVISVHGGIANFTLQPKVARAFRKGLLKAAKTTGAWIITPGIDSGVVRHVASALKEGGGHRGKKRVVTIGIAPWGLLKRQDEFIGREVTVPYHAQAISHKGRFVVLNDKHSYFLLADNGTVGRYGADIILRRRFEDYVSKLRIEGSGKRVPVVCLVLEGGACTIRAVLDYVTNSPPVPVVVCDGSGRAADLIAFTHRYAQEDGTLPELVRNQLLLTIQQCFDYSTVVAEKVLLELTLCVRKKNLITVFRLGEDSEQQEDMDHAILTALLKGQDLSPTEQLSLTLTWNRADIARSDIFVYGQEWTPGALDAIMMEALIYNRVDFVKLLLENGVSMEKFLTVDRLEELYNTDKGTSQSLDALRLIVSDVLKHPIKKEHKITVYEIGLVMQKLIGMGYRAKYCRKEFRRRLRQNRVRADKLKRQAVIRKSYVNEAADWSDADVSVKPKTPKDVHVTVEDENTYFKYPFSDLFLWSVLLRRQKMALCMWQHGEEALAKALIATRLYKSMAKEAAEDYLEAEICDDLERHAEDFRRIAIEFLEHCYSTDDDLTFQILTYELNNWGNETCLSLAYLANHMDFLAHPGCQILLTDLWHGGMRIRRNPNLKVLMGLLCPPTILTLDFKTKEELLLQAQTKEEYIDVARDSDFDSDQSSYSDSSGSNSDSEHSTDVEAGGLGLKSRENSLEKNKRRRKLSILPRKKESNTDGQLAVPISSSRQRRPSWQLSRHMSRDCLQMDVINSEEKVIPEHLQTGLSSNGGLPSQSGPQLKPNSTKRPKQKSRSKRPLEMGRKLYEFYVAPVTTFWAFTISYFVFIAMFTYIVLVRTTIYVTWTEIWVIAYVITFGFELVRKLCMQEPHKFKEKAWVFVTQRFNFPSALAVIMFLVAVALRLDPAYMAYGRVVYCCNIVYWIVYSLDIVSVHKYLGPYITMMGKMLVQLLYFTAIIAIVLMSFGVVRQSLSFPHEDFSWYLVRNIFYKPYFMIYGEVYSPEIDQCVCSQPIYNSSSYMFPECSSSAVRNGDDYCTPGAWLMPIFMAAFLLVCDILLINMLIAAFNNTFTNVDAISQQVWKYHSYYFVMEYEQKPWLPPPFIVISHIMILYKYCSRRFCGHKKWSFDHGLKLFLDKEDVEKLHNFEEECMDSLHRKNEMKKFHSNEERVKRTVDRADFIAQKVEDLTLKVQESKLTTQAFDNKLRGIEDTQQKILLILDTMARQITASSQFVSRKSSAVVETCSTPVYHDSETEEADAESTAEFPRKTRRKSSGLRTRQRSQASLSPDDANKLRKRPTKDEATLRASQEATLHASENSRGTNPEIVIDHVKRRSPRKKSVCESTLLHVDVHSDDLSSESEADEIVNKLPKPDNMVEIGTISEAQVPEQKSPIMSLPSKWKKLKPSLIIASAQKGGTSTLLNMSQASSVASSLQLHMPTQSVPSSRNSEYTSITDFIDTSQIDHVVPASKSKMTSKVPSAKTPFTEGVGEVGESEYIQRVSSNKLGDVISSDFETTVVTANESSRCSPFPGSQPLPVPIQLSAVARVLKSFESESADTANESEQDEQALAREHEEYAGALTADILKVNQEVGKASSCLANIDDLQKMGLEAVELEDYSECLARNNMSDSFGSSETINTATEGNAADCQRVTNEDLDRTEGELVTVSKSNTEKPEIAYTASQMIPDHVTRSLIPAPSTLLLIPASSTNTQINSGYYDEELGKQHLPNEGNVVEP